MAVIRAKTWPSRSGGERPEARFTLTPCDGGSRLVLAGDWTATRVANAASSLGAAVSNHRIALLDVEDVERLDTAGVFVLTERGGLAQELLAKAAGAANRPDLERLGELVGERLPDVATVKARPAQGRRGLAALGAAIERETRAAFLNLAFYGELVIALGRLVRQPGRIRRAPTVSQMDSAGISAIPIVIAANFFVGATIAFLGASLLAQFGASVFAVELVGVGVLREFAVLITAIILAGRSASSFAAGIGAMKMNQEIDAMEVMGVDPMDALVLPRFAALVLMAPLLTFLAMVAGLAGGLLVLWPVLDLSPQFFLTRIVNNVGAIHFAVGMVKAPVMAIVVAAIGCRHGFEVGGDVESLGGHVTSAVVQALFAIIAIDAVFALMFLEMNL